MRAVGAGVGGVVLVLLAIAMAFWRPDTNRAVLGLENVLLQITSWSGLRLVAWAALAGGTWLLAVAWRTWRGEVDDEPAGARADEDAVEPAGEPGHLSR